jgi:hypothetical protein
MTDQDTDDYEDDFEDSGEGRSSHTHADGTMIGGIESKEGDEEQENKIGLTVEGPEGTVEEGQGRETAKGVGELKIRVDASEANESAVNQRFGSIDGGSGGGGGRSKRRCSSLLSSPLLYA